MDLDEFRRRVGRNVRHARHLAGLTQEQIAGVTLRYFQEIERGLRNPTLDVLYSVAQQLHVTVADLVDVPGARLSSPRIEARTPANPPRPGRKARKPTVR